MLGLEGVGGRRGKLILGVVYVAAEEALYLVFKAVLGLLRVVGGAGGALLELEAEVWAF